MLTRQLFQSTRPRGARRVFRQCAKRTCCVSIHAPAWGATDIEALETHRHKGFNPRARVGRDHSRLASVPPDYRFQSTRPRGARHLTVGTTRTTNCVSIHAPAWGATMAKGVLHFKEKVSIHAPAWGATRPGEWDRRQGCGFNPRARVGRDKNAIIDYDPMLKFQSTRPRGARLAVRVAGPALCVVSIHAPAWGATNPFALG